MVHSLCFMCWPILDPIFSLHLGQPCIFSCSIKIYWDTQRTLHFIAFSKSWSTIAQLMSLSWHRPRAISWILLLKSTLKILILHGLSHKVEHDLFEFHTRTLSSFLLIDHIIFISTNSWSWCQYSRYIFYLHSIHTCIQRMIFKLNLWNIPSYETQWKH